MPRAKKLKESFDLDQEEDLLIEEGDLSSRSKFKPFIKWIILLVILVCASLVSVYFIQNNSGDAVHHEVKNQPQGNQELLEAVGKLILLPNEEPLIYQIDDPSLLASEQQFFADALAGDKLIIFPNSAKAIIYSQSRNLIVNVGPVSFDEDLSTNGAVEPVSPPPETPSEEVASSSVTESEEQQN